MGPLFDFNGDGKTDMLEFLMATENYSENPIFTEENDKADADEDFEMDLGYLESDDFDDDDLGDDYDSVFSYEE